MPFENVEKIPFAMGKVLKIAFPLIMFGGIHLHLSKLAFIYKFYNRMTVLVESRFWNPPKLII